MAEVAKKPGLKNVETSLLDDRLGYEREAWNRGRCRVAGLDEAGRGPLAGPVVAAAVIFPVDEVDRILHSDLSGIRDSKVLSPLRRDLLHDLLTSDVRIIRAVAVIEQDVIDRLNILRATHLAFRTCLQNLTSPADFALVDGLPVPDLICPSQAIVKGDRKSLTIGAASILAKVTRDRLMQAYAKQWPVYGFERHKGYATRDHLDALRRHGPCPIHRRSFEPIRSMHQQPELPIQAGDEK